MVETEHMYAILQQGGHQYRVEPGDRLLVERIPADIGSVIALEPILLLHDGSSARVEPAAVDGARVAATVVAHRRGKKLRVFKYKPKKRYRRTLGYRSDLTELRVESFLGRGDDLPEAKPTEAKPVKPTPAEIKAAAKTAAKAASQESGMAAAQLATERAADNAAPTAKKDQPDAATKREPTADGGADVISESGVDAASESGGDEEV